MCAHTLHAQEEQCNACVVEYTSLDNEKKKKDDLHRDPQDHVVGHYTDGQYRDPQDHEVRH